MAHVQEIIWKNAIADCMELVIKGTYCSGWAVKRERRGDGADVFLKTRIKNLKIKNKEATIGSKWRLIDICQN